MMDIFQDFFDTCICSSFNADSVDRVVEVLILLGAFHQTFIFLRECEFQGVSWLAKPIFKPKQEKELQLTKANGS